MDYTEIVNRSEVHGRFMESSFAIYSVCDVEYLIDTTIAKDPIIFK